MAALVQSYPQQSGTVTMLQSRPASATAMLPQSQSQGQQYGASQQRNNFYANPNGSGGQMPYRAAAAPIQPYAFTSTPSLTPAAQWQQFRALSSPAVRNVHSLDHNNRARYPASASMTNLPTTASMGMPAGSRDDSSLMGQRRVPSQPRPQSAYMAGSGTSATATQVSFGQATPIKISPDRYRRPSPRVVDVPAPSQQARSQASAQPSGSGMAAVAHLYGLQEQRAKEARTAAAANRPNSAYGQRPSSAVDDIQLNRSDAHEEAKRFRRRSMPTLDAADYPPLSPQKSRKPEESTSPSARPGSADKGTGRLTVPGASAAPAMHGRNNSSESVTSSRSNHSRPSSSANRNAAPTGNPAHLPTTPDQNSANQDYPKLVNIPARTSSSDATNRVVNPSPLSKPVTMGGESGAAGAPAVSAASPPPTPQANVGAGGNDAQSPAVKQLTAISAKGGKLRSKTSRLRRAFSFGSAQELKNADKSQNGDTPTPAAGPSKLHKEPTAEELYDAEQARIAQKQEEGGIGNSIYAGARIFSGSTDNLSISSTASSASIMIRKMGHGMKKGGRKFAGLFRPKSVIGVAPADGPVSQTSEAEVSMITVEAERERVNVNADPHSQNGGGSSFPRLERNSIDAGKAGSERIGSSGTDNSAARKSIVGGDRERAEVLAGVRKGILKRRDSPSPSRQNGAPTFELPQIPAMTDSPGSSAPSTPNDEAQGHKRTGSVAIGSEDYFMTALRLRQDTKSAPNTPQGSMKRNATFSPRIVFHDTWHSQEYDRRGEIATCNRLTPMLAQQIKEELNSFKMEMEVHENSKIYTHFF